MRKDTLVDYLKTLKIHPQKTKNGYQITYASNGLRMGLVVFEPKPSIQEINRAIEWLEENRLAIPVKEGELNYLIRLRK